MIRKILALVEYFYVANLDSKYYYIELPSNQAAEKVCPKDLHDMVMKRPILILIHSLNFTATLCLVSLVGITMLFLSKMYGGDKKFTSVKALVVILAIKAVLVLILSSTVFLHVAGYFVWLFCLIFDWVLIVIFACKLNKRISTTTTNRDVPAELKPARRHTRDHRIISCISTFLTGFVLLYIMSQIVGVSIDIADLVIIRPCLFRYFGIWINSSTTQEILEFIQIRDGLIAMVYSICFIFDFSIIVTHFFLLLRNYRKVWEKLLCKQTHGYVNVKKVELQEPLLSGDNNIWTDETYVKKLQGSSVMM
ncbi:hypothetical protein LOD99_16028 [Oopsacas minuta]|uniref:G-protein coupled receptors family 1 profile domain-containing protein n=1 Tax=Oopsacas minuta TaxID=111878 RepID=A0AAV7K7U0_9METZ|nr:hypothetical protein LOD99_16028 [Oopsacas minuta]